MTPETFWDAVDQSGDCWIWTRGTHRKYGALRIEGSVRRAHRVAWELVNGPIPKGMVVRHKCDNPPCCNPDHLEVGTQTDNMRDMWSRGRGHDGSKCERGEDRYNAVLTDDVIREIRARSSRGETYAAIARDYGIDSSHVRQVAIRKIWKHVA